MDDPIGSLSARSARQRKATRVQLVVGIAGLTVATLVAFLMVAGQIAPTDWTGAVLPVVIAGVSLWVLLKGVLARTSRR
jgi:hypothetical protein